MAGDTQLATLPLTSCLTTHIEFNNVNWSDAFKRKLEELGLEDFEGEPSLDQWRQLLDGIESTLGAPVSPLERRRAATEDLFHSLYPTFDAITRDLEEAVLLLDARGRIRRANPQGRTLIDAIDPMKSARIHEILADRHGEVDPDLAIDLEMMLNEHVSPIEGRLDDIGALPDRGPISYILSPLISGGPAVAAVVIRDHTEPLRLEAALKEAEDRAGNSHSEQSVFVANTSHELRTPLNGILGMTQLLSDTKLSLEQREFVEIIASSSESLLTLVNDILDFSKMEAGRLALESIDFNLRDVIDQVVKLLVEKAAEQNIELVVLFEEGVPTMLCGDPVRLRQVIVNLLGNAIKFTHDGEVSLTVRSMGMTAHVADLRFDIRDSGIGINSEAISRLFEPFSQADDTTTRKYGGTGLGLAICRQLVAMMEGEISADSVMGEGSLFWFTGRFDKQSTRDVSYTLVEAPAGLFDQRILLIEDNPTAATFIRDILERWGLQVTVAHDATAARRALDESDEAFHLVLADLGLPDSSAPDLVREIRSRELADDSQLRILLMGPPSSLHEGLASLRGCVNGGVAKPIRPSHLLTKLSNEDDDLPLGELAVDLPESRPIAREDAATRKTTAVGPRPLLLLAEDNIVNQKVAVRLLDKLGYACHVVSNGKEAVEAALSGRYAAVLMDCQMPILSGYEATAEIRSRYETEPPLPIIAMTANAMPGDRERCLDAGMDDYITKPIRTPVLRATLDVWLSGDEPTVESGESGESGESAESSHGVLDMNTLARLRALDEPGQPSFVAELFQALLEDAPMHLQHIKEAATEGDLSLLRRAAHTLKGSCANLGIEQLRGVCADIETLAHAGTTEGLPALITEMNEAWEKATKTIQTLPELTGHVSLDSVDVPP